MNKERISWVLEKALLASLCLFILFCPFFARVPKITAAIAFVLWIAVNLVKYGKKFYKNLIPKTNLAKPLLLFGIALIFSVIFSLDPYHSQSILFERYLYYFFFFVIGAYLARDKRNIHFLVSAIILIGIVIGIGGVWDLIRFQPRRLFSFYGNHIIFPPILALFIPFLFTIAVFLKDKTLRISAGIGFLLWLPVLLFAASRAAWGAVLFTILVVSFLKNRKLAISLLIMLLITGVFLLPDYFQKRANTTFVSDKWGDRVAMWEATIGVFEDFPVFGAGLGTTKNLLYKYSPPKNYKVKEHLHAHDTYLELLAEAGGIGLIAFLSLFAVYFKEFFKFYKRSLNDILKIISLGFTGSILAVLITGLAGSIMVVGIQSSSLFWLFFGIAAGLISKTQRQKIVSKDF